MLVMVSSQQNIAKVNTAYVINASQSQAATDSEDYSNFKHTS